MTLTGPDRYHLAIKDRKARVRMRDGTTHFVAPATVNGKPKLYVVSKGTKLLYVGVTRQSMSLRLRGGLTAKGEHGYWGYHWGRQEQSLDLAIWYLDSVDATQTELETVEGEVVYRYRQQSGQWPQDQTEIHFHRSDERHRGLARRIVDSLQE